MPPGIFGTLATLRGAHVRGTAEGEAQERAKLLEQYALQFKQQQAQREREVQDRDFGLRREQMTAQQRLAEVQAQRQAEADERAAALHSRTMSAPVPGTPEAIRAAAEQARAIAAATAPITRQNMQASVAARQSANGTARGRMAPMGVVQSVIDNQTRLNTIDQALAGLKTSPGSVGAKMGGWVGDDIANRVYDKEGATLRATIADIGSMEIRDRSGAAVSAAEFPRIKPFIPKITDDAATVTRKLARMRQIIAEETALLQANYGPENGFREIRTGAPAGGQRTANPPINEAAAAEIEEEQALLNEALEQGADRQAALQMYAQRVAEINRRHGVQR